MIAISSQRSTGNQPQYNLNTDLSQNDEVNRVNAIVSKSVTESPDSVLAPKYVCSSQWAFASLATLLIPVGVQALDVSYFTKTMVIVTAVMFSIVLSRVRPKSLREAERTLSVSSSGPQQVEKKSIVEAGPSAVQKASPKPFLVEEKRVLMVGPSLPQQADAKPYSEEEARHYISWFNEMLEEFNEIQQGLDTVKDSAGRITNVSSWKKVYDFIMRFSILTSPPRGADSHVYEVAYIEGYLGKINHIAMFLRKFKDALPKQSLAKKLLDWASLEPLIQEQPEWKIDAFPFVMAEQKFQVVLDEQMYKASWRHLQTCTCPGSSPAGIDALATQIASDLVEEQYAVIIDFGAGGCLPVLPIVSRLTHMKEIALFLVDPIYLESDHKFHMKVKHNAISFEPRQYWNFSREKRLPLVTIMGACAKHFPPESDCTLHINMVGSVDQLIREKLNRKFLNVPHVLYAVDPNPDAADDFQQAVEAIQDRRPLYYCLNELAGVQGKLTYEEVLNTDEIFSRDFEEEG